MEDEGVGERERSLLCGDHRSVWVRQWEGGGKNRNESQISVFGSELENGVIY